MGNDQDIRLPKLEIEDILSQCGFLKIDVWSSRNYLLLTLALKIEIYLVSSLIYYGTISHPRGWAEKLGD